MASYDYQYRPPRASMEVKVTITSAKDLKNVNWRHGSLKPYAVVWVDPKSKSTTKVDGNGDTSPTWDETLVFPLAGPIDDAALFIDIVHANASEDTKPLIGSARVPLKEIVNEVGIGESAYRTLKLRRPSGRPHGKLELKIVVRDPRYRAPDPYYAPPYGVPPPTGSRDYASPYGNTYAAPYAAPPSQYPSPYGQPQSYGQPSAYGQPPSYGPPAAYGQPPSYEQPAAYGQSPSYGQPAAYGQSPSYGQPAGYGQPVMEEKKKSKYGMGTGLAVGAVAGVLGGLALAEGADYVEDKIEDHIADRVEDDLGYEQEDDF
ncbi:hypothetical protein NE237_018535 [Protea cynaroides]|uniref:C2 domain-containing protein n=1 Tax=Protea cynaroides TaxID=273540 RepID=A0A9Q0KA24_9MAGN|nr:hypothetical protein NE237_018535 [Protea cynaroides]